MKIKKLEKYKLLTITGNELEIISSEDNHARSLEMVRLSANIIKDNRQLPSERYERLRYNIDVITIPIFYNESEVFKHLIGGVLGYKIYDVISTIEINKNQDISTSFMVIGLDGDYCAFILNEKHLERFYDSIPNYKSTNGENIFLLDSNSFITYLRRRDVDISALQTIDLVSPDDYKQKKAFYYKGEKLNVEVALVDFEKRD